MRTVSQQLGGGKYEKNLFYYMHVHIYWGLYINSEIYGTVVQYAHNVETG